MACSRVSNNLFFGVFRGLQNTYWAMYISLIGGLSNIFLDYILILGFDQLIDPMKLRRRLGISNISDNNDFIVYNMLFKKTPFNFKVRYKLNPFLKKCY